MDDDIDELVAETSRKIWRDWGRATTFEDTARPAIRAAILADRERRPEAGPEGVCRMPFTDCAHRAFLNEQADKIDALTERIKALEATCWELDAAINNYTHDNKGQAGLLNYRELLRSRNRMRGALNVSQ